MKQLLEFERRSCALEQQVQALQRLGQSARLDLADEVSRLSVKFERSLGALYRGLDAWQTVQVARHVERPQTLDYVAALCTEFVELHGDRASADDAAIVGGVARLGERAVVLIGHQKGRRLQERTLRNFGMPRPAGYRKAMRLMALAERFALPLVTLIDTPGAFAGIDAEERGQSAAIGECIYCMSQLQVPTVSVVIGEGGSGGALAIGVADVVCMLEHAVYSVISPEGCASILWKDTARAPAAAGALGLTAARLHALGLVDEIVAEPTGGAHRNPGQAATTLGATLQRVLATLDGMETSRRLRRRAARLRAAGSFDELG